MRSIFYNKNFLIFFFAIIFSSLIMLLSFYDLAWSTFWGSLKIPPNYTPFSDFKAHVYFLQCYNNGINIFEESCDLIPKGNANINTHPIIWVKTFDLLNLNLELNYNLIIFFLLITYFFILLNFLFRFKLREKLFLIILYFSTTNFILIERLATDLVIFIIVYFIYFFNSKWFRSILIYLGFILKYYPIFLFSIFFNDKKFLIITTLISTIIIILFFDHFFQMSSNLVEMALPIAYGSRTMLSAFYHLSNEFNFFLNDENLNFFRIMIVICFAIYSFILILVGYSNTKSFNLDNKFNKFFIGGASIFLGTFIIGSNADYRLIFLILTLPLIFELKNLFIKYSLLMSYICIFNSFYFLIGDKLSAIFFISSSLNFLIKILTFSLISLIFGSQLKQVNFFQLKF